MLNNQINKKASFTEVKLCQFIVVNLFVLVLIYKIFCSSKMKGVGLTCFLSLLLFFCII